jgi:hypothetical protein
MPVSTLPQPALSTGVSGTGPAFSAYQSASQTPAANVFTKLTINTEEFDTANCYDSSTNYRFTPNVAGYYQVSGCFNLSGASVVVAAIFKNGSAYKWGGNSTGATLYGSSVSCLVYLNGSTDYVEFYAYTNNGVSMTVTNSATNTWFQAAMVRAA